MMNFKEFRIRKGFVNVANLAKLLGITKPYIYMMDNGERTPGLKLMKKMSELFDTSLDEMNAIFFDDKPYSML